MIRNELRLALRRAEIHWLATAGIVFAIAGIMTNAGHVYPALSESRSAFQMALIYGGNALYLLFIILTPITAALSYTDCYLFERKAGVAQYVMTRRRRQSAYFFSKAAAISILAFALVTLPLFLNQLLCLFAYPWESHANTFATNVYSGDFYKDYEFIINPAMAMNHPFLTNILHICLVGVFAVALALTSYTITLYYGKSRASVVVFPFLISLSLDLISAFTTPNVSTSGIFIVLGDGNRTSLFPIICITSVMLIASSALIRRRSNE
ncbi:hypothetical protein FACS18949_16090 [Clostridia bacterium]|nr:hypothetical protein FACS18949_16090 [Clostridia bacterium]